jgi:general secretion pathway protein G
MIQRIRSREDWSEKNVAQKGFTLVELIVVVTILGILAAVVVFSVSNVTTTSQNSACSADASTIRTAISAYQAKNGASTQPTMAQLVTDNDLQQASTLFTIDWTSGLTLTGTAGCTGKTG